MDDYDYMKVAIKEAEKAYKKNEIPVGAIIVKENKIISKDHNRKEKKKCAICHAEVNSIRKATKKLKNWRLNNCVLYVTLEPCPMCASVIKQSRISKIVYLIASSNFENSKISEKILKLKDSNPPVEISKLDIKEFKTDVFLNFFKNIRN